MPCDPKLALRRSALEARRRLTPDERSRASRAVSSTLLALPQLQQVRTVAVYAATAYEVDVDAYAATLRDAGLTTLLPRVRGDHLDLIRVDDFAGLRIGHRGVREPPGAVVDTEEVDAVVVPGVAFDPTGRRLGHGGGHYDRLLHLLPGRTLRVGVAFACQIVTDVPTSAHDEVVDIVVTERMVYPRGAASTPA